MKWVDQAHAWFAASLTFASALVAIVSLPVCAVAPSDGCLAKATCASSAGATGGAGASASDAAELQPVDASMRPEAGTPREASSQVVDSAPRAVDAPFATDAGAGRDGSSAAVVAASCPMGYECAEPGPAGWYWGLAVWGSEGDDPFPACPPNYDRPFDMHGGLVAPDAVCATNCVASGQTCAPSLSIFSDTSCTSACRTQPDVPTAACMAIAGCGETQGTLRADAPAPSGGSCVPHVSATVLPSTWSVVARMCINNAPPAPGSCANPNAQCIRSPAAPFSSHLCVAQIPAPGEPIPTTCPSNYPNGPSVYYRSVNGAVDSRGCSAASCSGMSPVGGSCAGTIAVTGALDNDCTTGAFMYVIGSGCSTPFRLAGPLSHVQATYVTNPGWCSVATPSAPVGSAKPSGSPNVLCCK